MRITDLTLPIENTWNWNANLRLVTSHAEGDPWQMTGYDLVSHMYTHIDFPIHHTSDGVTSDAYPLEKYAITKCLMLDLTAIGPNGGIDAKMLEEANAPYKDQHFDSLIIRTDWPKKYSWRTREFWDVSCFVTKDGGEWIRDYAPNLVGYDFAQDYEIRKVPELGPKEGIYQPVHDAVLKEGKILQVEFLTDLWKVGQPIFQLIVLPLKIDHTDGGQVRAIAVTEE